MLAGQGLLPRLCYHAGMGSEQPQKNLPTILEYQARVTRRPMALPAARHVARFLTLAQIPALVAALAWAIFYVGPVLPKIVAFVPTPLVGSTAPAVAALSNEHPFPMAHLEPVTGLLRSAGGTILNGPNSAPAAVPERLEVLHLYAGEVTWIEFHRGWIEVGKGMIVYWPNAGGWHLLDVYDAEAAWRQRGWGGNIHGWQVCYTKLPEGFTDASHNWGSLSRESCVGWYGTARHWQSPVVLRILLIAILLWGLWSNVVCAHRATGRRERWLVVWVAAMCIVALLAARFIRPAMEFFVLPWRPAVPWVSWQPVLLVPCAIAVLVVLVWLWGALRRSSHDAG